MTIDGFINLYHQYKEKKITKSQLWLNSYYELRFADYRNVNIFHKFLLYAIMGNLYWQLRIFYKINPEEKENIQLWVKNKCII